jgi:general secretion pathway protein L
VCCYGDAPQEVQVDERLAWQHPLVLIQPQWQSCRINMLHGEFSGRSASGPRFRHAKKALAAAALLCVGLLIGPRVGMAWMLTHQQNEIHREMTTVAQHYFPTLRQTSNLKYYVGQNISKAKKGIFLQLEALNQIRQSLPSLEINNVEYDETQNQLTLNVKSMDKQTLQDFVARSAETFEFTMQPISGEAPYTAIITGSYK